MQKYPFGSFVQSPYGAPNVRTHAPTAHQLSSKNDKTGWNRCVTRSEAQRFKRSAAEKVLHEVLEEKMAFTNERDKKGRLSFVYNSDDSGETTAAHRGCIPWIDSRSAATAEDVRQQAG